MIGSAVKKAIRARYLPGGFYRIPYGPNAGRYFEYDPSMILGIMLGLHEPNTFAAARQVVRKGATVLDIGANRGYFTIFFDALVGDTGQVFAFEPMPDNFGALERTVKRNHCRSTVVLQKAVSNRVGSEVMYSSENHLMSSLIGDWAGTTHGEITVETVTVDSLFRDRDRGPDFIKMDIEGGGVYALPGMQGVIQEFRPVLCLESHTPQEDRAIGEVLQSGNYAAFRIGSAVPVTDLNADYTSAAGVYGSILAVPREGPLLSQLKPALFQKWRFGQRW
jgi:FkbM family methyltransferase